MSEDETLFAAAGQVLVGGFSGASVDPQFGALVKEGRVGGAILFNRNFKDVIAARRMVEALRALPAPEPLLMSIDQEGGRVQRLRAPFPELPPMRAVGATKRKTVTQAVGRLLAQELRLVGFHQDYAPVLDVDSNPANPIIGDRAFSSDPGLVARLGAAFIDAIQTNGVAACGKHFPGHGDTSVDSHLELPRLDHDRARLDSVELVPFKAACRIDVAAIMTAHIVFAALDSEHPATLSEKVLEPLLRRELGFLGVIVSDDLEMKAIADHYGIADAAVRALRAGCDQLLICHQPALVEQAHQAILDAVKKGTLAKSRLLEAASRVRAMKARYVPRADTGVPADELASRFDEVSHRVVLDDIRELRPKGPGEEAEEEQAIVEYEFEGDPNEVLELDT